MTEAYDPELRAGLRRAAEISGTALHEGVYMWFSGPSFETPAEIRMARVLGADAVGMVHRAGGDPRPLPGAQGRGLFGHHQSGGRHDGPGIVA